MTNALRSIAFVLEQLGDDMREDRIASRVREQLAEEGEMLAVRMKEAADLIDKAATTAAETATRTSQRVMEEAGAALQSIQKATLTVTITAMQLSETTTMYRDAVKRATAQPQLIPASAATTSTLNVRVRAREGSNSGRS